MHQIKDMQPKITNMQLGTTKRTYSMEELCPYPFDKNLCMPPFPSNFTIPHLPKYKKMGDHVEHIK